MDRARVVVPKEVLAGLQAVRASGKTNMFDVNEVIRLAFEMEHYDSVLWIEENRSLYVQGVFHGFSCGGGDKPCAD